MIARTGESGASTAWSRVSKAAIVIGAICSLGFTLWAGRNNPSLLLNILFVGWVLLPYAGLFAARRMAEGFPPAVSAAMHAAIASLSLFPAVIYALVAILAPGHPATFAFLAVPAVSGLALGTLLIAARFSRRT